MITHIISLNFRLLNQGISKFYKKIAGEWESTGRAWVRWKIYPSSTRVMADGDWKAVTQTDVEAAPMEDETVGMKAITRV